MIANLTEGFKEVIHKQSIPEIFNTDQESKSISDLFTRTLSKHNILISMDGPKRALDKIFVERLCSSVKYENIFLNT